MGGWPGGWPGGLGVKGVGAELGRGRWRVQVAGVQRCWQVQAGPFWQPACCPRAPPACPALFHPQPLPRSHPLPCPPALPPCPPRAGQGAAGHCGAQEDRYRAGADGGEERGPARVCQAGRVLQGGWLAGWGAAAGAAAGPAMHCSRAGGRWRCRRGARRRGLQSWSQLAALRAGLATSACPPACGEVLRSVLTPALPRCLHPPTPYPPIHRRAGNVQRRCARQLGRRHHGPQEPGGPEEEGAAAGKGRPRLSSGSAGRSRAGGARHRPRLPAALIGWRSRACRARMPLSAPGPGRRAGCNTRA